MSDREAFNEFTRGAAVTVGLTGSVFLVIALLSNWDGDPPEKFVVVDRYKGCDVVRYTDRYYQESYFLHCDANR